MRVVEREERHADSVEHDLREDAHASVEPQRALGRVLVRRRDIALDDALVARVGREVRYKPLHRDDPEDRLRQDEAEIPHGVFVVGARDIPERREVLARRARLQDEQHKHRHRAAHEDDALDEIRPDDCLESSERAVDHREDTADENTRVNGYSRNGIKRNRGEQRHDRDTAYHEDDERRGAEEPHAEVEALFEVFVCRGYAEPAEERQVVVDRDRRHADDEERHHKIAPVLEIRLRRYCDEGDRRKHRREDRHSGDIPRYAVSAAEVVVLVLLLEDEEARHADHQERIDTDDRPRHRAELAGLPEACNRNCVRPCRRRDFAARDNKRVLLGSFSRLDARRRAAARRICRGDFAILAPRVGHAVVGEDFALPAELHGVGFLRAVDRAVDPPLLAEAADHKHVLVSARQKRRAYRRRVFGKIAEALPRALLVVAVHVDLRKDKPPAVVQRLSCLGVIAAVDDEQLLLLVAVLNGGDHLRTRRKTWHRKHAPREVGARLAEIGDENMIGRDDVHRRTVRRRRAHRDRSGQGKRKRRDADRAVFNDKQEGVVEHLRPVRSSRTENPLRRLARHALGDDARQLADLRPLAVQLSGIDARAVNLFPIDEIAAAGNHKAPVG